LNSQSLPCPKTDIFYYEDEAVRFIEKSPFPIVAKFNIGASGKGVKIIRQEIEAKNYIEQAFSDQGVRQSWGPNLRMGSFGKRILNIIKRPQELKNRLRVYSRAYQETQKKFVIFQEYIPHDFEWRVVRIGDSYFGHQKVKLGDKASGSKGIKYVVPSEELLFFVKNLCEKYKFNSMAVDLFEANNKYLINELQCIFGHVQKFICENNGKPGRFRYQKSKWVFEEGMFNTNLSYDLRLEDALKLLEKSKNI
jgi:glutathione synthase/RimK-type ligase-like ATP-grasp enzyme